MTGHDGGSTPISDDQSDAESPAQKPATQTAFTILRLAIERLRSDHWLVIPFAVAAVLVASVDSARQLDPIPASRETSEGLSVELAFYLYPTGTSETARSLGAIIDLLPRYLLWAIGLELIAVLAVGLAGCAVIARELDQPGNWRGTARYIGILVIPIAFVRLAGGAEIDFTNGGLIIGIPLLMAWAFVLVRLFVLPVCLVAGHGTVEAIQESVQTSRGTGWTILGLIVFIGVGTSLLGSIPRFGAVLSTALLAPLHAITAVIVYK